jgi:elongation factor Ts
MANITASDVAKLRSVTGAGMMDCKNALVEANGDFEKAQTIIREKGKLVAAKRSDRETKEGAVIAQVTADAKTGVMICLGCETDFVSKNEQFQTVAKKLAAVALANCPVDLESFGTQKVDAYTVNDYVTEQTGKTGEKHSLACYEKVEGEFVAVYNHMTGKVSSMVAFSKKIDAQVAKNIAMKVASMNPVSISKDDCPADIIARELEIGREQARLDGKPEAMLDKIAQGKVGIGTCSTGLIVG